jgi:hypothetical protein
VQKRLCHVELSDNNSNMRFVPFWALFPQYSPLAVARIVACGAAAGTLQLITGITMLAIWCYLQGILVYDNVLCLRYRRRWEACRLERIGVTSCTA